MKNLSRIGIGMLVCISAYVFNGCKKNPNNKGGIFSTDPCKDVSCLNGGTCNDGVCLCPQGYSGSTCASQITPSQITITKITVTSFVDGGEDGSAGPDIFPDYTTPDIYVKLLSGSTVLYNASASYKPNPNTYDDCWRSMSPSITLSASSGYNIELWDRDGSSAHDPMGPSIYFTPYSSTGGFPATKSFYNSKFSVQFDISYVW